MCGSPRQGYLTREPIPQRLRFEVLKRDNFACVYCGKQAPSVLLEIDHLLPVASGGKNEIGNLVVACLDCNRGKGANHLDDRSFLRLAQAQAEIERIAEEERQRLEKATERLLFARARLFHSYWGVPVIPEAQNPYFDFLRKRRNKVYMNYQNEETVKFQTAQLLVTKKRIFGSNEKRDKMELRAQMAHAAGDEVMFAREDLRRFWLTAKDDGLREQASTLIDGIDNTIDAIRQRIIRTEEPYWSQPIYPDFDMQALDWILDRIPFFEESPAPR